MGLLNILQEEGNAEKSRETQHTFLVYPGIVQQPERRQGSARSGCKNKLTHCKIDKLYSYGDKANEALGSMKTGQTYLQGNQMRDGNLSMPCIKVKYKHALIYFDLKYT